MQQMIASSDANASGSYFVNDLITQQNNHQQQQQQQQQQQSSSPQQRLRNHPAPSLYSLSNVSKSSYSSLHNIQAMLSNTNFDSPPPQLADNAYLLPQQQQQVLTPMRSGSAGSEPRLKIDTAAVSTRGANTDDRPTPSPQRRRQNYTTGDFGPAFNPTVQLENVVTSDGTTCVAYNVYGRIDKGFFLAGNDWACYRRNYFQASGAFTAFMQCDNGPVEFNASDDVQCLLQIDQDRCVPILRYTMGISACVGSKENPVALVQHTSKRDKGPQLTPVQHPIRCGGNVLQTQMQQLMQNSSNGGGNGASASAIGQSVATFERIQFKSATANNGKRRAAQQYYVISLDLFGEVQDEMSVTGTRLVKIASTTSSSLVVRGRSPGHYADSDKESASPYGSYASSPSIQTQDMQQQQQSQQSQRVGSPLMLQSAGVYGSPSSSSLYQNSTAQLSTVTLDSGLTGGRFRQVHTAADMHQQDQQQQQLPPLSARALHSVQGLDEPLRSPSSFFMNCKPQPLSMQYLTQPIGLMSASSPSPTRQKSADTAFGSFSAANSLFSTGSAFSPTNQDGSATNGSGSQLPLTLSKPSETLLPKFGEDRPVKSDTSMYDQFPEAFTQFDSNILPF